MALQSLRTNSCPWCEVPASKFGDYPSVFPRRDHLEYMRVFYHNDSTQRIAQLTAWGVRTTTDNVLWRLRCNPTELPKPDLLHTIQVGMLKHLLLWIMSFLKSHHRLALFNSLWMAIPSYLSMTQPKKSFEEIVQWTGGEYKKMTRFLVGCLATSLHRPSDSERSAFEQVILCARGLCEFYMYCQYPTHDAISLDSMEASLGCFHDNKDVFLEHRASKQIRMLVKAAKTKSVKARDLELKKTRRCDRQKISGSYVQEFAAERARIYQKHTHFNFPKIHLTSHFRESIEMFGSLEQHSTSATELLHKSEVKKGYRGSNKTGDFYSQILESNARIEAFDIRKLNLKPQSCDMSSPNISHLRPPHVLKSPTEQHRYVFGVFLASISNPELRNNVEIATYRFLNGEGISVEDEELDMVPIVVYKSIAVHVLKYGMAIWEKQILRCTLETHWHGGPPRHDWAWWRACRQSRVMSRQPSESPVPPLPWKALKGRLPVQLISRLKFSIIKDGKAMPDLQLAFVQTTTMAAGGAVERASGMVKVVQATPETEYRLIHASEIDGAAHLIPFDPDSTTNCT